MIVFASAIREPAAYERPRGAGHRARRRARLGGVRVRRRRARSAATTTCILDQAADRDGLEALVLVDEDIEIADPDFCAKVRRALADPDVGLVGCAGATGVESAAWWDGAV